MMLQNVAMAYSSTNNVFERGVCVQAKRLAHRQDFDLVSIVLPCMLE